MTGKWLQNTSFNHSGSTCSLSTPFHLHGKNNSKRISAKFKGNATSSTNEKQESKQQLREAPTACKDLQPECPSSVSRCKRTDKRAASSPLTAVRRHLVSSSSSEGDEDVSKDARTIDNDNKEQSDEIIEIKPSKYDDVAGSESTIDKSSELLELKINETGIMDASTETETEIKMTGSQIEFGFDNKKLDNSEIVCKGSADDLVELKEQSNSQSEIEAQVVEETDVDIQKEPSNTALGLTEIKARSESSSPLAVLTGIATKVAVAESGNDGQQRIQIQKHTTPGQSTESNSLSKLKTKSLTDAKKGATISVSSQTISFPSDGENISRNKVQLIPSKFSKPSAVTDSTTEYRISLEAKKTHPQGSKTSVPSTTSKVQTKTKIRGLIGWNTPQHLVKRKMKGLESSHENTAQLLKHRQTKGDSISSQIEKYQRKSQSYMTVMRPETQPSPGSREKQKSGSHDQVEKRVHHLEKMKNYEEAFHPDTIPDSQRKQSRYYKYTQRDREMDMWLHHVQYHHHKHVQTKTQLAGLPSQQRPLQYRSVATLSGARDQGHFVYTSDTAGRYYDFQGRPISASNVNYSPTVQECEVEIEGTPLNWIAGIGCGEWKPFYSSRRHGDQRSERIGNWRRSQQQQQGDLSEEKKYVDSLVELLHDEIAQGLGENPEDSIKTEMNVKDTSNQDQEELHLAPETVPKAGAALTGISSSVNIVMAAAKRDKKEDKQDPESILMKELDDATIRRGSEFRG